MVKKIIKTQEDLAEIIEKLQKLKIKEYLVFAIEKLVKADNKQLRSYWMLIDICRNWMNSKGNNFSIEEVDYYFRIKSGHYKLISGEKIVKSLSRNKGTTKDDMNNIINTILEFGIKNNIENCNITSYELKSLLENYK